MALIRCHECSREISDLATACPQCGAPRGEVVGVHGARDGAAARSLNCGCVVVLAVLVFVVAFVVATLLMPTPKR